MTNMTLTATPQPRASSTSTPLNVTTLLASIGSNTGVQFANSNREVLYVQLGTAASTIVVAIGATVEGEPVTSVTYNGVANDLMLIGPFDTVEDTEPGNLITVTFGTAANVSGVALVANAGAY